MKARELRQLLWNDSRATTVLDDVRAEHLIPEDCIAATGYGTASQPELLILSEGGLVKVRLEGEGDQTPARPMAVELVPLDPKGCRVRMVQTWTGDSHVPVRRRSWEIRPASNADVFTLSTEQPFRGFEDERRPPPAELFARALARRLGYELPDEDPA